MRVKGETEAIFDGMRDILASAIAIQESAIFINGKIRCISECFTSINFDRINSKVQDITKVTDDVIVKLEIVRSYMSNVIDCIDRYSRLGE